MGIQRLSGFSRDAAARNSGYLFYLTDMCVGAQILRCTTTLAPKSCSNLSAHDFTRYAYHVGARFCVQEKNVRQS